MQDSKTGSPGDDDADSDSDGDDGDGYGDCDDGEHNEQLMIRWSACKPHRVVHTVLNCSRRGKARSEMGSKAQCATDARGGRMWCALLGNREKEHKRHL